jgi:hypothetical protein
MEESNNKKQYKTFKEYYQDENFKKKHKEYVSEKVLCECGRYTARSNMIKHQKTRVHQKELLKKQEEKKKQEETENYKQVLEEAKEAYFSILNKLKEKI